MSYEELCGCISESSTRAGVLLIDLDGECVDFFLEEKAFNVIEGENDCKEAVLTLKSAVKSVENTVHTLLDGTAMITRWLEVTLFLILIWHFLGYLFSVEFWSK